MMPASANACPDSLVSHQHVHGNEMVAPRGACQWLVIHESGVGAPVAQQQVQHISMAISCGVAYSAIVVACRIYATVSQKDLDNVSMAASACRTKRPAFAIGRIGALVAQQ